MDRPFYTIGIKREFLPGFKKYRVLKHSNETVGLDTRLLMSCYDGSIVAIPDIAKKHMKLYSDYNTAIKKQRAMKQGQEGSEAEVASQLDEVTEDANRI